MFLRIIALGPKMVPPWGSIVLHRLIKGNVKNLQVSDSGPLWPSCFFFSEEDLLQVAYEVLQGLAYLNRHNVTHRNLKPENVLLDTEVRPN